MFHYAKKAAPVTTFCFKLPILRFNGKNVLLQKNIRQDGLEFGNKQ